MIIDYIKQELYSTKGGRRMIIIHLLVQVAATGLSSYLFTIYE